MSLRDDNEMRAQVVRFAESLVTRVEDWQDVQEAIANHETFGPWLEGLYGDDGMAILAEVQGVISEAEDRVLRRGGTLGY